MIRRLDIENFRRFEKYSLVNLGRVNLLVGDNNCGKTTVLEAIELLRDRGNPETILQLIEGRSRVRVDRLRRGSRVTAEYLFHGYSWTEAPIQIRSRTDDCVEELGLWFQGRHENFIIGTGTYDAGDSDPGSVSEIDAERGPEAELVAAELDLEWRREGDHERPSCRVLLNNNLQVIGVQRRAVKRRPLSASGDATPTWFIPSTGSNDRQVVELLESVTGNPEEDLVRDAVRRVAEDVDRLIPVATGGRPTVFVRLQNQQQRVPLGVLGDGVWRLLGIALALVHARDGVLLVDEIDSGIYYERLTEMWRFVFDTAKNLNVQVFATTHSSDCVDALADICDPEGDEATEVTLQRINPLLPESVSYTEAEIVAARDYRIEVR